MKRKHTPNEMQNITSFFAKKNPTPTSLPHPTQNEQTITPPQESEQLSSPSHYSTQNSPQNEQGQCSPNAPIFGERLSEHEFANLPQDPGKRRKMSQFHKDDRDLVRRIYIQRKPCQPKDFTFPQTSIFGKNRRFCAKWFDTWTWLEYSVEKDAAYCFPYYLFKDENAFGGDAFVSDGFKSWNRSDLIRKHVGKHLSAHNNAVLAMDLFKKQNSSITQALTKQTDESNPEYSKVVFKNAPSNCQLTSPKVQKDIINACAKETTKAMLEDIDGGLFSILADESADVSDKEQLALCLRYVNRKGEVCERLLGIVHVVNTASLTLKTAIESLLMEHSLSFSQVRGQGYDGASNMQGSINGLTTLIENECKEAYFVHCFAHQLQLTQVALAKKNSDCAWLFVDVLAPLLNFVGGSPKRKEFLRENQAQRVVDALSLGELETGSGLNQERGLGRPCDTRWGSHFKTILNVLDLFPVILGSLEDIAKVSDTIDSNRAQTLTNLLMSFGFVFVAHLMVSIFAITNALNVALQKHDQDIVNAMAMVNVTKTNLQKMRDEGWDSHMEKVISFIGDYDIAVPDMEAKYVVPGRRLFRGKCPQVSNLHHFRVEVFFGVIDLQLQELENRFPEITKELLVCMSCLSPVDRFSKFDKEKLIKLAKFYPNEFPSSKLIVFGHTLDSYICSVRGDERFWNLKGLSDLSIKLVETGLSETHDRVYLLLKLVLLLPVATASVERAQATLEIKGNLEAANKRNQELEQMVKSLKDELRPLKNIAHKAEGVQTSLDTLKERLEKQEAAITKDLNAKAKTKKLALAKAMMEDSAIIMKMTWSSLFPKASYAAWDKTFHACTKEYNRRIMQQAAEEDEKEEEAAGSNSEEEEEVVALQPTETDASRAPAPENESTKEDALKNQAPVVELDQAAVNTEAPPNA
ncbi:zinc finger MYM-type protein 1-like [Chenopodium quinoa]|uniref:zinc finger MYM-type protein 1-like n=1 Tax=Chenopodium quinoa TaxID=63459 RepID=UPI000B7779D4|nr:zinc finger MYM-type protein 1-like [Chenopodium quinoa]